MIELQFYIGIAAGLCSLGGYVNYALDVIRGKYKPERASWLIWTLSSSLIVLSYYSLGARNTLWVPLAYLIGTTFITILSFKYGRDGWGFLERITLLIGIITAIRWVFFDNVFFTLITNLLLSFSTYINRIKKLATGTPKEEQDLPGWMLYFIGSVLNIFAINTWNWEISTLPIVYLVMNGITFFLILRNHTRRSSLI